jgi:hypothetical protein
LDIKNIQGNVIIDDGSGDINISGVDKNVTLIHVGSGGVELNAIKGQIIKMNK